MNNHMTSDGYNDKKSIILLFLFFLIFSTYPFVFNLIIPLPPITFLMFITLVGSILIKGNGEIGLPKEIVYVAFAQLMGTLLSMFATGDIGYYKQILYIIWVLLYIDLVNKYGIKDYLFYYHRILTVVAVLGVISFVLSAVFGARTYLEYTNMDGRPGWLAYFTFTNINMGSFIRYSGIFDEPGAMAFWGMIALIINKLYVHDKIIEVPLIVCLLFTFSIAYIIQLALYLFFFYGLNAKFKKTIVVIIVIVVSVLLAYHYLDKDSHVYMLTFGRLGIGSSYNLLEDSSRAELTKLAKNVFESSPMFGIGTTAFYGGVYMADNPYETLAKDGIIGSFFIYLPLVVALFRARFNLEILFAVVILMVGYLQRPFHMNFLHYSMLYIFLFIVWEMTSISVNTNNSEVNEIQHNHCDL